MKVLLDKDLHFKECALFSGPVSECWLWQRLDCRQLGHEEGACCREQWSTGEMDGLDTAVESGGGDMVP